jgi:hypothetical protein
MQIGPYSIGATLSDYSDVRKLPFWKPFDVKRKMRRLRLYASEKRINVFGGQHEVILGVLEDAVWSLSILFAFKTEDLVGDKLMQVVDHYSSHLGQPKSDSEYPILWLSSSGRVTISVQKTLGAVEKFYSLR